MFEPLSYKIHTQKFTGPLDLLLSLIENKKLEITEIALSEVTEDFVQYIKRLKSEKSSFQKTSQEISEFLVVASRLLLIKSRQLLPELVLSQEESEDIDDLKHRLEIFKEFRNVSAILEKKLFSDDTKFSVNTNLTTNNFSPPKNLSANSIHKLYEKAVRALVKLKELDRMKLEPTVSIEEKIIEITDSLRKRVQSTFSEVIKTSKNRTDKIVSFLAILELVRTSILSLEQTKTFGEIKLAIKSKEYSKALA